jgi:hypothetical protein
MVIKTINYQTRCNCTQFGQHTYKPSSAEFLISRVDKQQNDKLCTKIINCFVTLLTDI